MARVLQTFVEDPRPCGYLPLARASLEYRVMLDVGPEELDALLARGWRRFGPIYFRPQCTECSECVSIRIPVERFVLSASRRRVLRRFRAFRVVEGPPQVDDERIALHEAWYSMRADTQGWEPSALDEDQYSMQFAFPHPSARELAFYDGDRLVAVSLVDVTRASWSAIYFFYAPDIARISPGVANILLGVERARAAGIPHLYLGYRVLGCASMRYKSDYRPHELLEGRPEADEEPTWR